MALPRIESITNRCIQQGWRLSNDAQGQNSRNGTFLRVEQKALRQTGGDAETLTKQLHCELTVNRVVTPAPAKQLPDRANAGRAS